MIYFLAKFEEKAQGLGEQIMLNLKKQRHVFCALLITEWFKRAGKRRRWNCW